ncbi:hypothetical protein GQ43DRAFT_421985 [Delitschia confertaspora ATCC 74209]|uniref:LPXTG-motif cell wall anchor domain protein n=1 Tax=Delitschia confertaspora ATCC 74209 TaxID=1513339 RepID=A0A9P4JL12_9PLEO|nr:hypothetical protein GQ43DRAFT_421985 [Delitschia confertaspora ATCC 74209]
MMPSLHSRRRSSSSTTTTITTPKHQPTNTASDTPPLLRLPSLNSATAAPRQRRRRATTTTPSSPSLTPNAPTVDDTTPISTVTSPSYFSPQPTASGTEARSPATRRPPASFSGHGIDTSRGPPIALITRGSYSTDIARRQQKPSDFPSVQHQLPQSALEASPVPPPSSHQPPSFQPSKDISRYSAESTSQTQTPHLSRQNSVQSQIRREEPMASSIDESSEYDSGIPSQASDLRSRRNGRRTATSSVTDGEQTEDLFLNIAQDSPQNESKLEGLARRRTRLARDGNRPSRASFPTSLASSPAQSSSTTPSGNRIASTTIDTRHIPQFGRTSHLPSPSTTSRTQRDQSPLSPAGTLDNPRSRYSGVSPQSSFSSSKLKDPGNSSQYLSQFGGRRPSYPDTMQTPPSRLPYRPSNLHYTSARSNEDTSPIDTPEESHARSQSRATGDGTESLDSTGPPASVWDELDDLKSRIRRIEQSGKMPSTSAAVVSSTSGDRPQTATTSITTVSSSPKHYRKQSDAPAETTNGTINSQKVHPLLHSALAKAKESTTPQVYRILEATANEALELAVLTGGVGPQGTLFSASSIIGGATVPERQVRRKAENICRSLTELCIAIIDTKPKIASPVFRTQATSNYRRASVPVNGDSPHIRASVEPENNVPPRSSPSRAMSRIEARRSSVMGLNSREASQEPQDSAPSRINRTSTSLFRTRTRESEEDDDPTLRAPSRAMTDFNQIRSSVTTRNRLSREYTSREPMPELHPSSLTHTSSLRQPSTTYDRSNLLYRDSPRRYTAIERQNSPAIERTLPEQTGARLIQQPLTPLNLGTRTGGTRTARTGSLGRRLRGNSVGD